MPNIKYPATLITEKGCGEFAGHELNHRFGIEEIQIDLSATHFLANQKKLVEIFYKSQTAKKLIITLSKGIFDKSLENLIKKISSDINSEELKSMINNQTIKVDCERLGDHDFNSVIVEQNIGIKIEELLGGLEIVDLKNPEIKLYLYIDDKTYIFGIDLTGTDLSKRQYRLFNHPNNIKGTIAYCLLIFANYEPDKILVDPFALSGTIPIEAALFSSEMPVNYYEKNNNIQKLKFFSQEDTAAIIKELDTCIKHPKNQNIKTFEVSFNNLNAQKKNAKIAGIEKSISFSRTQGALVDLKLEEKSIDIIASRFIEPSKNLSEHKVLKIYEEFFPNIIRSLKKKGIIALILRNPELAIKEAKKAGFKLIEKKQVWQGKQEFNFIKLEK